MQRLLCAAKFRQDVARDGRLTVDDQKSAPPFSVHCMQLDELLFFAITHCDYPRHLVFPAVHPELGLLPHLATSCLASGARTCSLTLTRTLTLKQLVARCGSTPGQG